MDLPTLGGDYRLTASYSQDRQVLVTGLPMTSLNATLHDVAATELAVFAGVLLLAGVGGTGLVRVSLRPLRRVAAAATRVTELPLAAGQATLLERAPTPARGPRSAGSPSRSTTCSGTSSRPWPSGPPARRGCAGSLPTPVTSCARRWPRSAATPSSPGGTRARCPTRWRTPWPGWRPSRPG